MRLTAQPVPACFHALSTGIWYDDSVTTGFKVVSVLWWIFLLAVVLTALLQKPEGPHIGDPFDVNNPYRP